MDPSELPQEELKTLTNALLDCLTRGSGEHNLARFHVDVEGADEPEVPNMTRGGRLASMDKSAKGKPFASGNVTKQTYALLKAATKIGRPLYLVQYDFSKGAGGWEYALKVQSLAEYQALCDARRPLEDSVLPALLGAVEPVVPDWREISWNLGFAPMSEEKVELFASVKELQPRPIAIPDFLRAKVEEFRDFYRTNGFELQLMKFQVLGGPKKKAREVEVWYV
jgi:hypothetical protein